MTSFWLLMASVCVLTAAQGSEARETLEVAELHQIMSKRHVESSDEMPETLALRLRGQDGDTTLLLTRSDLIPEFPRGNDVSVSRDSRSVMKDAAVYTDERTDGHFIVRRNGGRYHVSGSFLSGDDEVSLEPLRRQTDSNHHVVTRFIGTPRRRSIDTRSSRAKRAVKNHVVEVFFVTDYSVYTKAQTLFGKTGYAVTHEIRLWYTFIANMVARVYKNIEDPDLSIQIKVKGIQIDTSSSQSPWTEDFVQDGKVLDDKAALKFEEWVTSQQDLPRVDHFVGITAYDLVNDKGESVPLGLATVRGFCDPKESNSVVEDDFTATTAGTVAHEMAHNFGAVHDEDTACSSQSLFMMASHFAFPNSSQQATRPWLFSACSQSDMKAFLDTVSCSLTEGAPSTELSSSEKGGQYISPDKQCQLKMGTDKAEVCRSEYGVGALLQYADVCMELKCCGNGSDITSIQALDFTQCGNKKWCVQGLCVSSSDAPAELSPNCPFGDRKATACAQPECPDQEASYRRDCCTTCAESLGG